MCVAAVHISNAHDRWLLVLGLSMSASAVWGGDMTCAVLVRVLVVVCVMRVLLLAICHVVGFVVFVGYRTQQCDLNPDLLRILEDGYISKCGACEAIVILCS